MLNWVNDTVALVPSSPVYSLMVQSGIVLEFIPNYDSLYFQFGLKFPVSKKSFVNLVDFHRRYVLWVRHLFSGFSNISELRNKLTRNWKHSEFPSWNYYNILTSLEWLFFPVLGVFVAQVKHIYRLKETVFVRDPSGCLKSIFLLWAVFYQPESRMAVPFLSWANLQISKDGNSVGFLGDLLWSQTSELVTEVRCIYTAIEEC